MNALVNQNTDGDPSNLEVYLIKPLKAKWVHWESIKRSNMILEMIVKN